MGRRRRRPAAAESPLLQRPDPDPVRLLLPGVDRQDPGQSSASRATATADRIGTAAQISVRPGHSSEARTAAGPADVAGDGPRRPGAAKVDPGYPAAAGTKAAGPPRDPG